MSQRAVNEFRGQAVIELAKLQVTQRLGHGVLDSAPAANDGKLALFFGEGEH